MKKKQKNKIKEFSIKSICRTVLFVFVVGIIFFLIGQSIWQTKNFIDRQLELEEREHVVKIQNKLSEMKEEMIFFQKIFDDYEKNNEIADKKEINQNTRSILGDFNDLERYYLDRRFDFSLELFGEISMTKDKKFEQLKKLTRDGELFLDNMNFILSSSDLTQINSELVKYNFKVFSENYFQALGMFY